MALAAAIALACVGAPTAALAAFPGADPSESPRLDAPDDPDFDRCELDDADTPELDCTSYFDEDFRLFGFSPDTANTAPAPPQLHPTAATRYADCRQLDAQGRAANVAAGDPPCAQLAGIRADTAWKYSTGDPEVAVAILDTGIRWQDRELVDKVRHAQTTVAEAAGVAAVAQCLVATLAHRLDAGERLDVAPSWRIEENRWWAARDGIEGELGDLVSGERVATRKRLRALLGELAPTAARLGCESELAEAERLVAENGALRQRAVAEEKGIDGLVGWLAERWLAGA